MEKVDAISLLDGIMFFIIYQLFNLQPDEHHTRLSILHSHYKNMLILSDKIVCINFGLTFVSYLKNINYDDV